MEILLGILKPVLLLSGLGLLFGLGLSVAYKKLSVAVDERVEQLRDHLPGANCGGCGYAGCDAFAEALASGETDASRCAVCSAGQKRELARILGAAPDTSQKRRAFVACGGGADCLDRYAYTGPSDCAAAALIGGGPKSCVFACLGMGNCVKACSFGALRINDRGVAEVDPAKCVGCGQCVGVCPRKLIRLIPETASVAVACASRLKGAEVRRQCKAGCLACGACVRACASGAIVMEENLPRFDEERCVGCGQCAEKCPTGAIRSFVHQSYDETGHTK